LPLIAEPDQHAFAAGWHLHHEREAARQSGDLVDTHDDALDGAAAPKKRVDLGVGRHERKIADIEGAASGGDACFGFISPLPAARDS
jgi:hypothetical protein